MSDRKLCMLWIWSYPVSKNELFLKLAVPKKQAKPLKTIWKKLRFHCICRAEILLKKLTLSQEHLKGLAKLAYHPRYEHLPAAVSTYTCPNASPQKTK